MKRTRVEQVLDEIAQLSPEEQKELTQALPRVLQADGGRAGLTSEALEHALAIRERIRERLAAEGRPLGSVSDDIEALRDERLDELDRMDAPARPES